MAGVYGFNSPARSAGKNQGADGARIPQARRCGKSVGILCRAPGRRTVVMNKEIDLTRRCFTSMLTMTFAATHLGLVRSATAESKTPSPSKAAEFFPGFSAELITT